MTVDPDYDKRVLPYGTIANCGGRTRDDSSYRRKSTQKIPMIKPPTYRQTHEHQTIDITDKL